MTRQAERELFESVIPREESRRMAGDVGDIIDAIIRDSINRLSVSEWAEEKRILPRGLTSMPGPFRWDTTPYLREIADCFSESSPVQKVAVMKGSRVGATVGIGENWLGYIIDAAPGSTLFIGGDKESAESAVELRLDRMIQSAGIQHKIFSQSEKSHNKKTGDTKSKKEFAGGFLMAIGPNVAAKLRSFGVRYLFFDEVDAYPSELQSEGDPITLAERRTDEYELTRKILYISTPLVDQTSRIKPLFEAGDQRRFFVPCRHCGHMQPLRWRDPSGDYRLKYEVDELGRLVVESVHYECERCGGAWRNEDKAYFLPRGEWRPTAEPMEPNFRSYHIPSLLAPVGMRTWESIAREWIAAKHDQAKLRPFMNTVLGETWEERGEAPEFTRLMMRRDSYHVGELPAGAEAYVATLAADVQKDRIEAEVVAWGPGKESWSLGYHILEGNTEDLNGPAWTELHKLIASPHAGLSIMLALIDSGFLPEIVNSFCERFEGGVLPCRGDSRVMKSGRTFTLRDVEARSLKRVDITAHEIKLELYRALRLPEPPEGQPFPAGYCHFPIDYGDRFFQQLTAEELHKERAPSGAVRVSWRIIQGRRNEAHDCRIYNMTALNVFMAQVAANYETPISADDFWLLIAQRAEGGKKNEKARA